MTKSNVRVRFAPSPTGPLHMGGVRTALYNYLFAKKHNGTFILRIEDTDQARFVPGAEDYIIESLKWCGIEPDEGQGFGGEFGPYRQSERKEMYRQYAEQLVESGNAYYAFDTAEELEQMRELTKQAGSANWQYNHITRSRLKNSLTLPQAETQKRLQSGEPYVIRIKLPRNEEIKFQDIVRGWVSVNTNNMDDKVLFKSDGMPTYHLANIVDDHLMKITHVIRGEEWLPSAPLHVFLYQSFGWDAPEFAHLPLLLRPDGNGKLSKRDGDRLGFPVFPIDWKNEETGETASGYRERGFFPGAFINMLAFLGWNPGDNREIFSRDELVESFSLEKVSKAGARFDFEKAKWFNQQYLRAKTDDELVEAIKPFLVEKNVNTENIDLYKVVELVKERAVFIQDIVEEGAYLFMAPTQYDEKTVSKKWNANAPEIIKGLRQRFEGMNTFTAENLELEFKNHLAENNLSFGQAGPVLRLAISGMGMGPSIFEICEIIGREETLARMDAALKNLPA